MAAHAGERAWETGNFHCSRCGASVHIEKGEPIPKCPVCGNDTYGYRTNEPD